jgi:hypothetical protein
MQRVKHLSRPVKLEYLPRIACATVRLCEPIFLSGLPFGYAQGKKARPTKQERLTFLADLAFTYGKNADLQNCFAEPAFQRFISLRGRLTHKQQSGLTAALSGEKP